MKYPETARARQNAAQPRQGAFRDSGASRDREGGRLAQGLRDDAVTLGQLEERGDLVFRRVGVELEAQADGLEAYRGVLRDAERAAEVEVAFGMNAALLHVDANGGGHGAERDAGAGDERFEQHVARARAQAVAAGGGVQSGCGQRLARLDAARDAVTKRAIGLQRDDRRVRHLAVLRLQRRLEFLQLFGVHAEIILWQTTFST